MKLFLIRQSVNDHYNTYSDAVVAAEDEGAARLTHPSEWPDEGWPASVPSYTSWALPEHVTVEYIGEAAPNIEAGVVCASFHAG